jgi:GNAT superfamily N-acetyltransferase
MSVYQLERNGYVASSDPALLDLNVIHGYLQGAYWSMGIPREIVARAIEHSLCVGAYHAGVQVGFARVITDYATFAYVADVFVLEAHRGNGAGKLLLECLSSHPDLQEPRTWMLLTRDAHGLYRQVGFGAHPHPERVMIKQLDNPYAT